MLGGGHLAHGQLERALARIIDLVELAQQARRQLEVDVSTRLLHHSRPHGGAKARGIARLRPQRKRIRIASPSRSPPQQRP